MSFLQPKWQSLPFLNRLCLVTVFGVVLTLMSPTISADERTLDLTAELKDPFKSVVKENNLYDGYLKSFTIRSGETCLTVKGSLYYRASFFFAGNYVDITAESCDSSCQFENFTYSSERFTFLVYLINPLNFVEDIVMFFADIEDTLSKELNATIKKELRELCD